MTLYRKRPVTVEAVQWFKYGDHPDVGVYVEDWSDARKVRCCGHTLPEHGYLETNGKGFIVCPGDWIVTEDGEDKRMSPAKFASEYEPTTAPGWKLVPIEPTEEMLVAGQEAWAFMRASRSAVEDCKEAQAVFSAMLVVAPEPPATYEPIEGEGK